MVTVKNKIVADFSVKGLTLVKTELSSVAGKADIMKRTFSNLNGGTKTLTSSLNAAGTTYRNLGVKITNNLQTPVKRAAQAQKELGAALAKSRQESAAASVNLSKIGYAAQNAANKSMEESTKRAAQAQRELGAALAKSKKESAAQAIQIQKVANAAQKAANVNIEFKNKQEAVNSLIERTGLSANKLKIGMSRAGFSIDKAGNILDAFGKRITMAEINMGKLAKSAKKKFNAVALSMMFMFMGLKRLTDGFLRSAVTSFQKADEETEGLGKSTWELSAAWEFFKYSLVDALSQSWLFNAIISGLLAMVQWLNRLSPAAKVAIAVTVVLLSIAIAIGMVISQFALLASSAGIALGWILLATLGIFIAIIGIGIAIYGLIKIGQNWGKDWNKVMKGIIIVAIGLIIVLAGVALAIWAITGASMAMVLVWGIAIIAIIAVVALAVVAIIKYWDDIKIGFFKMVAGLKSAWVKFKAFTGLISEREKEQELANIKETLNARIDAIKKAQAARKAAADEEKNKDPSSIFGGGMLKGALGGALPSNVSDGFSQENISSTGQVGGDTIINQTNQNTLQMPEGFGLQEIYDYNQSRQDDELTRLIDTNNN